jgi:hypothetical protein
MTLTYIFPFSHTDNRDKFNADHERRLVQDRNLKSHQVEAQSARNSETKYREYRDGHGRALDKYEKERNNKNGGNNNHNHGEAKQMVFNKALLLA